LPLYAAMTDESCEQVIRATLESVQVSS
jgi:hypothetical protein